MDRLRTSPADQARLVLTDAGVAVLCVLVFWLPFDEQSPCPATVYVGLIVALVAGLLARSRWPVAAFVLVATSTFAGSHPASVNVIRIGSGAMGAAVACPSADPARRSRRLRK